MASAAFPRGCSVARLIELNSHKTFIKPKTQLDYYTEYEAHPEILKYVGLSGGAFGGLMEHIAGEIFGLGARNNSGHDHTKNGKTIEQKSSRYTAKGGGWMWQHIEMKHEWDYLLICGLNFDNIRFYISPRDKIEELVAGGVITGQGKQNAEGVADAQQAYWFSIKDFTKNNVEFSRYFTEITSEAELDALI
jgi:hypothetical protein